jgi:uncharacterized membrane protein YidH (DUF202 family)
MEQLIQIGIYIHAFFGGISLIAGLGSMIFQKGSNNHKKSGKVFSASLLLSSLISLPIAWIPNHKNIFLFLIGVFTIYLIVSGNRILSFKKKKAADTIDKTISWITLFCAVVMLIFGVVYLLKSYTVGILFLFFGGITLVLALRDFAFYKNIDKKKVLPLHIGKISGAYIAAVTAFLVAGIKFQGLAYWIGPTIIGGIFIFYWIRKVTKKPKIA